MTTVLAFVAFLREAMAFFKWIKEETKEDPAAYLGRVHSVYRDIHAAKSPEEYANAGKRYQDLIRRG